MRLIVSHGLIVAVCTRSRNLTIANVVKGEHRVAAGTPQIEWMVREPMERKILLAFAAVLLTAPTGQGQTEAVTLALVGGTIYSSPVDEPIRDGVILIGDGTIVAVGRRAAVRVPEQARIIELRYFIGLSVEEAADALSMSPATLKRRWALARAWLFRELSRDSAPPSS